MNPANVVDLRRPIKKRRPWKKILGRIGLVLVLLVLVAAAGFATWHFWPRKPDLGNVKVVERLVARHYILPDEEPELATVTDHAKLQTPFLKKAQNGDKLLVYAKAGRAIIYRPSADRIVDVGPVNIQPVPPSQAGQ